MSCSMGLRSALVLEGSGNYSTEIAVILETSQTASGIRVNLCIGTLVKLLHFGVKGSSLL